MSGRPPFFAQERDYSCVPACLRMVLAYHGLNLPEDDITYACNTKQDGTWPDDVVEVAKELGFKKTSKDRLTVDQLASIIRDGHYPIIWMATGKLRHAVVLVDIQEEFVELLDPAHKEGQRVVPLEIFLEQWERQGRLAVTVRR